MLSQYLEELKKVEVLTREAEIELWHSYKSDGNLDARRKIIESYQPLVFKIAAKWRLSEDVMLDAIQEGTIGLIEAAESYNNLRGVAFSLFAAHRIRGRMINYLKKEKGVDCASLDSPIENSEHANTFGDLLRDYSAEVTEKAERNYLVNELKNALGRLPLNEQLVLSAVYLEDSEPKELADSMDMSLSYIYRLQKQGIRRLRGIMSKVMGNWR